MCIQLTFTSFNTESDYDFFTIYGSDNTTQIFRESGDRNAATLAPVFSPGSQIRISFTSDDSEVRSGVAADLVFVSCNL